MPPVRHLSKKSVAEILTASGSSIRVVVLSFDPEHAPLEQRQVESALFEAEQLRPKPRLLVFAAFQS